MITAGSITSYFQHKAVINFIWLGSDRVLRLLISLWIGSWVAKYLGITDYGKFIYVLTWMAIVSASASLGMDGLIIRSIIKKTEEAGTLLGTLIIFRFVVSLLGCLGVILFVYHTRIEDSERASIIFLMCVMTVGTTFQSLESGELWFQAKSKMRQLVVPRISLFIVINGVKVALILSKTSLMLFVMLNAFELIAGGLLTFTMIKWGKHSVVNIGVNIELGMRYLRKSWPLAISGFFIIVYMKISALIVSGFLGDAALGLYAAASRVVEAVYVVPVLLSSSILPYMLGEKEKGLLAYRQARLRYYRISALAAYLFCIPVFVNSISIVNLLYGQNYTGSGPILAAHAWSALFVFMGVARGLCLMNEERLYLPLFFTFLGLVTNAALSFICIPLYGPIGAAYAVVGSYAVSAVLTSFIFPSTRSVGTEQLIGMATPWRAFKAIQ